MSTNGGAKGWLVLSAVAALVVLAMVPIVAGTASASSAPQATVNPSDQWAYGGTGYSNGSVSWNDATLTWNATFGYTVVFTQTNTSNTTYELEETRTVGISVTATLTAPNTTASYSYHAQEVDTAFANLTTDATVYVNDSPVAALGLMNDSSSVMGKITESISVTHLGVTRSADLNVNASAQVEAQFTPALGLIPLNLSGVRMWNSTATIAPSGAWSIAWSRANDGFGSGNGSGSGSSNGTFGTSGTVYLVGHVLPMALPTFEDHRSRTAIVLAIEGPLGNLAVYDGFVLTPPAFALFGAGTHGYDAESDGSAQIGSQALYMSAGARGPQLTAGETTFSASDAAVSSVAGGPTAIAPSASPSPGATVQGMPMSVASAQAEANCLTAGCGGSASSVFPIGLAVVVVGLAVVAVVGSVAVIEWRSYARRKARKGLVGGYAESWSTGVPPAAVSAVTPPEGSSTPDRPTGPEQPPHQ